MQVFNSLDELSEVGTRQGGALREICFLKQGHEISIRAELGNGVRHVEWLAVMDAFLAFFQIGELDDVWMIEAGNVALSEEGRAG